MAAATSPVDLPRIRRLLTELDAHLDGHPEIRDRTADMLAGELPCPPLTGGTMTMTTDDDPTKLTAFRLPQSLIARLDRCAAKVAETTPWAKVTRADVARMALIRGLDAWEAEQDDD